MKHNINRLYFVLASTLDNLSQTMMRQDYIKQIFLYDKRKAFTIFEKKKKLDAPIAMI